jgi:hypothetical protein
VWERLRTKELPKKIAKPVDIVTAVLEGYAEKAVFRGFSAHPGRGGRATYQMVWHFDRPFELLLDVPGKTLRFPDVLPGVPARSAMYRELRAFMKVRQTDKLPEHRRVNPAKARLTLTNQRGAVALKLTVKDGDFDYATRKMIQVVHEVFMVFLVDGPYYEYMVERLGLDPDRF